jgi:leucyl aminopeptidase
MEEMKYDMSGAASVIGSMDIVSRLSPRFEVIGAIPAVENMPGGNAIKPGDVVTAFNGKTIEIINTDAEGRLILADALAYVEKEYSPQVMLDFATLTGSCMVALGDKRAGLFSNNEELSKLLKESGELAGERLWPMPMDDLYKKELESEVADIKNIGSRWGGAISAAKFLEEFVSKTTWAHIDMAGTANDIKHEDYLGKGATGFGTRLIGRALKLFEKYL